MFQALSEMKESGGRLTLENGRVSRIPNRTPKGEDFDTGDKKESLENPSERFERLQDR
jgi:hypothetical protein